MTDLEESLNLFVCLFFGFCKFFGVVFFSGGAISGFFVVFVCGILLMVIFHLFSFGFFFFFARSGKIPVLYSSRCRSKCADVLFFPHSHLPLPYDENNFSKSCSVCKKKSKDLL